jgi:hypothetical protein
MILKGYFLTLWADRGSGLGGATEWNDPATLWERTMKNIAVSVALAAIAIALVISGSGDARADQSGDPDFCYGGWVFVPSLSSGFWIDDENQLHRSLVSGGRWMCPSG